MSYISLIESNCKHCHLCVANCPTSSIAFINKTPEIVEEQCILCGECYVVCPQHAKSVLSDFDLVLSWIKQGEKVHASLAPSFVALLKSEASITKALMTMGFASVEETSKAAVKISDHYRELSKDKSKNVISTCCPVVVSLIEKYYPHLVDQLAPVVSPMRAHGKMINENHPKDKVVFIGPCIAKIKEAHDSDEIDAVITFEEILDYLDHENIESNLFSSSYTNDKSRQYPTTGGILASLIGLEKDVDTMVVDGIEHVKDCCQAISNHQISGVFIEMSACFGSCLNGPMLNKNPKKKWKAKQIIEADNKHKTWKDTKPQKMFLNQYKAQEIIQETFSEEEINQVLQSLGKLNENDHLNCQACGYQTCVDKAVGVLEKKADPDLCLPYILSKAQSLSNLILEHTPHGIIVVNDSFDVIEINPSACRSLKTTTHSATNKSVFTYLPSKVLKKTLNEIKDVEYFIEEYTSLNRVFDHACIPIEGTTYIVILLMDLTQKIIKEKEQKEHRDQILTITQKIIDEQMITVQEIAGLLGESSAQSKIALETLKSTLKDN